MNATITREIISDLLPAYLSGEASSDTRTLIESYMKQDPEFAAQVKAESKALFSTAAPSEMGRDREMEALHKTRRALHRRAWHLGLAIFFTLITVTFHIGPEGIEWTWHASHAVAVGSGLLALFFWIAYFHGKQKLKPTGV